MPYFHPRLPCMIVPIATTVRSPIQEEIQLSAGFRPITYAIKESFSNSYD